MYKIIFAAALIAVCPSFATAGGGGGKNSTGTIRVENQNEFDEAVLVAVDPSDSLLNSTSLSEWTARGGKVILSGDTASFTKVRAGDRTLWYAFANEGDVVADLAFQQQSVSVSGGQTTTVVLTEEDTAFNGVTVE